MLSKLPTLTLTNRPPLFCGVIAAGVLLLNLVGVVPTQAQYVARDTVTASTPGFAALFGEAVSTAGDINGDNMTDFIVGAPDQESDQAGAAYLISGADGSVIRKLQSDNPTYLGNFGADVAGIGDVGGVDSTPDVIVGAPGENGNGVPDAGRAYIVDGANGNILETLISGDPQENGDFGNAVSEAGNVGGDATPDVLVGASSENVTVSGNTLSDAGRAYLLDGSNGTLLETLTSDNVEGGGHFGADLASVGDVGGASTPDVLIGAPEETEGGNTTAGRAYLFDGSDGTVLTTLISYNSTSGGLFGSTIESPGDLGGTDATPDFLVGATGESGVSYGRIYLIDGADGSKILEAESLNPEDSGNFGDSITKIGDVGGSSTSDLLVGAPGENVNGVSDAGRAYIVDGENGDVIDVLESPVPNSPGRFGDAVAGIGDQNGNGTPEIVIGASKEDAEDGTSEAGNVYVHTIPNIDFADGRNGESYNADAASPGDNEVPVGRFKLSSSDSRSTLDNVTVSNEGTGASDVSTIALWRSADNSFKTSDDNTKIVEKSFSEPATFTGVGESIPTGGAYFFIVVDLGGSASGEYDPAIASDADIGFLDGRLFSVNGTQQTAFSVSDDEGYLSTGPTDPLPVELTTLEATATGDGAVTVRWATASETNNAEFRVMRKVKGEGQEAKGDAAWVQVGSVDGSGTTTQPQSYRFTDEELPYDANVLQYRLRQVDTDGTAHLSDVVTVERGTPDQVELLGTYPNPARTQATVNLAIPETADAADASLRLYDVMGRQVRTVDDVSTGRSTVAINVSDLASGVYVLRLSANGTTRTQRVTVVR